MYLVRVLYKSSNLGFTRNLWFPPLHFGGLVSEQRIFPIRMYRAILLMQTDRIRPSFIERSFLYTDVPATYYIANGEIGVPYVKP